MVLPHTLTQSMFEYKITQDFQTILTKKSKSSRKS